MKKQFVQEISPIAFIKSDFKQKFGIPRQSGRAPSTRAQVCFVGEYNNIDCVRELENFSHLWLIFGFHKNKNTKFSPTVRPPRLGGNKKVGVFASRSPYRPNQLGLSCVVLERVEFSPNKTLTLIVGGADLLDGTPVYDIKPYIPSADKIENAVGGYSDKFANYKLTVNFPKDLLSLIDPDCRTPILECLADDPRPSYQQDGKIYGMTFDKYDIKWMVEKSILTVLGVEEKIKK